ncbi:MAG: hypothetical protein ACOC2U_01735 [bacterium]
MKIMLKEGEKILVVSKESDSATVVGNFKGIVGTDASFNRFDDFSEEMGEVQICKDCGKAFFSRYAVDYCEVCGNK